MSTNTVRLLIAFIIIAHGLVHYSLTTVPLPEPGAIHTPFWPSWRRDAVDPAWLASRIGLPIHLVRTFGWLLWIAVLIGFTLAGLGMMGIPGLHAIWQNLAVFGAITSLVLLAFYWHPWLVLGVAINLAVLVSIWQQWPLALFAVK